MIMYLGRIISAGVTSEKMPYIAYRVSSRSFPNRQAVKRDDETVAIIPKEGYETDIFKNTYIAYNCVKIVGDIGVISNGSQTDVIADKIRLGMNIKDALAYSLLTMDYEKDDYNTPRIAAVVKPGDECEGYVGIVTDEKILVDKIPVGKGVYISTYECNNPELVDFDCETSADACEFIFNKGVFEDFEHPVTSTAGVYTDKWDISTLNP